MARKAAMLGSLVMGTLALAFVAGVSTAAAAPLSLQTPARWRPAPPPRPPAPPPPPAPDNSGSGNSGSGSGNSGSGKGQSDPSSYASTTSYPAGSLLARAQANPRNLFKVIIQTKSPTLNDGLKQWVGPYGHVTHSLKLVSAISLTLPGWAILFVAEHPQYFGGVAITEDVPVLLLGQSGPDNWQTSVGVDSLWSQLGITCLLGALGLPIDPTCTPKPAYTAPQAPAIAIVDSGIDPNKAADFGARVVSRVNFASDNASGDPEGHGTMVAGVAAGSANAASGGGVAQNAPLVDLRVANAQGQADTSDVIAALDWVLQNKSTYNIRVVNLSLAGNVATSFRFDPLDAAVERLWLNGVVVVAAAGNNGLPDAPSQIGAPGNDPFVVTVGALDTNATPTQTDDFRAPWSSYGYTPDGFLKPELSAPGRYMVAPMAGGSMIAGAAPDRIVAPGYMWMSGTSFSAPIAAGIAAQLLALHPSWTPDQVKGALMAGATQLAGDGTGIGEVNAVASSQIVAPPNPNENLDAFVSPDPATGLQAFSAANWTSTVESSANWTSANWTSANWTSANWTSANWTSANWTAANWTASGWVK